MPTAYEKLGLNSQGSIDAMLNGVDLSRFKGIFFKGHRGDPVGYNANPNDSYAGWSEQARRMGMPENVIESTIEKMRQREEAARVPVSEEELKKPVAAIMAATGKIFKKKIGREASQEELAALINQASPPYIGSIVDLSAHAGGKLELGDKADEVAEGLAKQYGLEGQISTLAPRFKTIDRANLQLQNMGEKLPPDLVQKLLAQDTAPEEADVLANTYIQTAKEKKLTDSIPQLQQEEGSAIDTFEKQLGESNTRYLNESVVPTIIRQLNARGLAQGPDLASSIADAGAGLQREIQGQVAPLRAQSGLGSTQKKYEQILRGALESGQSLNSAMDFARGLMAQGRQNEFAAGQANINRAFQQEMQNQQMALQMAMMNAGGGGGPSGLDLFLQYGLPVIGGGIGAYFGGPQGAMLGSQLGSAGGNIATRLNNAGSGDGGLRNSGFTPRRYADYAGNLSSGKRTY